MTTLHIEHAITDFATWKAAFDRFTGARERAGVTGYRIHQPVDDAHYLVIQLDFEAAAAADGFREFLRTQVWSTPGNAPGLAGTPQTRILDLRASG